MSYQNLTQQAAGKQPLAGSLYKSMCTIWKRLTKLSLIFPSHAFFHLFSAQESSDAVFMVRHFLHWAAAIISAQEIRFSTLLWKEAVNLCFSSDLSMELIVSQKQRSHQKRSVLFSQHSTGLDRAKCSDGAEISFCWRNDFPGICCDAGAERRNRYWAEGGLRMC